MGMLQLTKEELRTGEQDWYTAHQGIIQTLG